MVRIKHRYFLVQILYPESTRFKPAGSSELPDLVRFHQPTPDAITGPVLLGTIRDAVAALYGDYGAGAAGTSLSSESGAERGTGAAFAKSPPNPVKYFSPATSTFILRCPRAHFRLVWASLTLMTALYLPGFAAKELTRGRPGREELPCVLRVVRVSGTIRKAEEAAIRVARQSIAQVRGKDGNGSELLEALRPEKSEPKAAKEQALESSDELLELDEGTEDEEEEGMSTEES